MTPEERADAVVRRINPPHFWSGISDKIREAIEAAVAEEREACAQVVENGRFLHHDSAEARFAIACGAAIRGRVNQSK